MKYINKIRMMAVAGLALATASCTDFSDYNSAPDSNATAGNTLLENIKGNKDLQNFAAIIDKAGYGEMLNTSQAYTLWAPLDGTYDVQSVLAMDSLDIINRFIRQHMAQFSYPVSGTVDSRIITLNDKHHDFTNTSFDNLSIVTPNIPSSNGLMHTIGGMSQYYNSIYQSFVIEEGKDKLLYEYIKAYDSKYIDKRKSIEGPLVNGQKTYLDTVWATTNPIVERILNAEIENDDSTYLMLIPTDKAMKAAQDTIKASYKFPKSFYFMDVAGITTGTPVSTISTSLKEATAKSKDAVAVENVFLQDSLTKRSVVRNLVFSHTNPHNDPLFEGKLSGGPKPDTLYSTNRTKLSNVQEILDHVGPLVTMSNGFTRTLDTLIFKPYETYSPIYSYKEPIRTLGMKSGTSYTRWTMQKSDVPASMYSDLPPFLRAAVASKDATKVSWISTDSVNFQSASARPEFAFALTNVQSKKYKIFVVFSPFKAQQNNYLTLEDKPLELIFYMAYNNESGGQMYHRINVAGAKQNDAIKVPADGKFSYIELPFTFPMSYSGLAGFPTLFVLNGQTFTSTSNRKKYQQEMRIQGVYLVPEDAFDYIENFTE